MEKKQTKIKIGVYVCHCGGNISEVVDINEVVSFSEKQGDVALVRNNEHMCSEEGQKLILDDVKEHKLDRVVVAACSPQFQGVTFMRTVENAGLSPYVMEMANIREQCSWPHFDAPKEATEKAKFLTNMTIAKARLDESLAKKTIPIGNRVLVIGAGIAGIQAALDLGDAGFEVHLVEKSPTIGGKMAQLSRTFPTEDCAACILSPKMADVPANPNINLLTYSEIEEISGYIGNFNVKIRKKPRYVDMDKCTACDDCTEVCPVIEKSEFDMGLVDRKAIYKPSPIAVPNKFLINKKGTPLCKFNCPANVNVQGYIALIAQGMFKEALTLELEENPLPSICGRVCTHPCECECKRGEVDEPISVRALKRFITDNSGKREKPKLPPQNKGKVAIVGSGPSGLTCGWALAKKGYKTTIHEALPVVGGMLITGIPEFRLPRKELEKDIKYIKEFGVEIKTNSQIKDPEKLLKDGYDAVYIATGAHIERKLGIEGENLKGVYYGIEFLRKVNLGEKVEVGKKVAVIGGGNSAVDAARTALRMGAKEVTIVYRRSRKEMPAIEEEIVRAEEEGIKIKYLTLPKQIMGAAKVEKMECYKMKLGEPDESGRRRPIPVKGSEFIIDVDTIIATIGQSPDTSFIPKKTNIKIDKKWNSFIVDSETLQTSVPEIFAGGDAVAGPATVVEAIEAAKEAAISIDRYISGVDLKENRKGKIDKVEKVDIPADLVLRPREKEKTLEPSKAVKGFEEVDLGLTEEQAIQEAKRCISCGGCCECMLCEIACEPKAIVHNEKEEIVEVTVDTIIVATGYDIFDATQKKVYGYGEFRNVINALEMERIFAHASEGIPIREIGDRIAFIQCVGSRDEQVGNDYCSRICCMYATKLSQLIKRSDPKKDIYVFYTDLRAYGKGFEEYYKRAQEAGVKYIRGKVAEAFEDSKTKKVTLKVEDTLSREIIAPEFDTVVLSVGSVANPGTKKIAEILRLSKSDDGFLKEAHLKFKPVDTLSEGVFLAGTVQGPKDIPDSVAQGSAASSRAITFMNPGEYTAEPYVSEPNEDICSGCGVCVSVCPYGAPELVAKNGKKVSQVNELLCKCCGGCISACPSGAMEQKGFTSKQILAMVKAAF